jgi:hypothetical protein
MSQLTEWFKDWNSLKDIRRHVKADLTPDLIKKIADAVAKETGYKISSAQIVAVVTWAIRLTGAR